MPMTLERAALMVQSRFRGHLDRATLEARGIVIKNTATRQGLGRKAGPRAPSAPPPGKGKGRPDGATTRYAPPAPPASLSMPKNRPRRRRGLDVEVIAEQRLAAALLVQRNWRGRLARAGRLGDDGRILPRGMKNKKLKPLRQSRKAKAAAAKAEAERLKKEEEEEKKTPKKGKGKGKGPGPGRGRGAAKKKRAGGSAFGGIKGDGENKPPALPYWFTYVAYTCSTLWMLICGYTVVTQGLKFEANSCTFKKFEKGDCKPDDVPMECSYPTKHGCMDITYNWLISSTMALVQDFCVNEPFAIFYGSFKAAFLGSFVAVLVDNYEAIKEQIESMIPF